MMQRDVAPKHELAIVRLEQIANAIQMFEVNRANSLRLRFGLALPFPELERFIFADMKKLSGE